MNKKSVLYGFISLFVRDPGVISSGLVRFGKIGILGLLAGLIAASFWQHGLTDAGLLLVMAILGAAEKILKEKWGKGLALALALTVPQMANAQTIQVQVKDALAIGGGSMLGEESLTFSWDGAFVCAQWNGVGLIGNQGSTGVGAEFHPAAIVSADNINLRVLENVDWRVWSLNRVKMSALQLPGEIWESMFLGSDVLVAEGGHKDFTGGFTARFAYGVREGPIQVELYMFEKYKPIYVAVYYRF